MVVRDKSGSLLYLVTKRTMCSSSLVAETSALNCATQYAENCRWKHIVWCRDAKGVVDEILSHQDSNGCETRACFLDIKHHLENLSQFLRCVRREKNVLAYVAAKFTLTNNVSLVADEFSFENLASGIFDRLLLERPSAAV